MIEVVLLIQVAVQNEKALEVVVVVEEATVAVEEVAVVVLEEVLLVLLLEVEGVEDLVVKKTS